MLKFSSPPACWTASDFRQPYDWRTRWALETNMSLSVICSCTVHNTVFTVFLQTIHHRLVHPCHEHCELSSSAFSCSRWSATPCNSSF